MANSPEKQGRRDFERGQSEPPRTYYSQDYRDAWRRGWAAAEAEYNAQQAELQSYEDQWRGLPASARALHEMQEAVGYETAEKIKNLINALIAEAA